jgi:signal peptidase I
MPDLKPATSHAKAAAAKPHSRDSIRETAETIVFVVGLVLMLKLFVVEAFVIPTGSMAETLLGYNKVVTCPECGYRFAINSSDEAEPPSGHRYAIVGGRCPNCRHAFTFSPADAPPYRSGDRVLVHKALYHFEPPQRGDVVVFKYPVDPQVHHTAQNYIKRLWGFGGETIAINRGDLYRTTALTYDPAERGPNGELLYPRPENPNHAWERGPEIDARISKTDPPFRPDGPDYTYHNAAAALNLFAQSRQHGYANADTGFELIRKTDSQLLAMRRIVYDNAHQPKSAAKVGMPPRWSAEDPGWTPDDPVAPKQFDYSGEVPGWIRYKHRAEDPTNPWLGDRNRLPRAETFPPEKISHAMGYNSFKEIPLDRAGRWSVVQIEQLNQSRGRREEEPEYWVGDLILECSATLSAASDEVTLELSKGPHRYQAHFSGGQVRLTRTGPDPREFATRPTPLTSPGTYSLRFANVDCRLRVWVNDTRIDFGDEADYPPDGPPEEYDPADHLYEGWVRANDIEAPASVGAKGTVSIRDLVVWRDTYFTPSGTFGVGIAAHADTFYVHPQHYLCLGDNSAQSSDGRTWGTVPERLLLGKAAFVFWPGPLQFHSPFQPMTWTLRWGDNRIGIIR